MAREKSTGLDSLVRRAKAGPPSEEIPLYKVPCETAGDRGGLPGAVEDEGERCKVEEKEGPKRQVRGPSGSGVSEMGEETLEATSRGRLVDAAWPMLLESAKLRVSAHRSCASDL